MPDTRVDFGNVEWGETAFGTVSVTNSGETYFDRIELGEGEMEESFSLHLGRTVYCDVSPSPSANWATGRHWRPRTRTVQMRLATTGTWRIDSDLHLRG